MHIIAKIVTNGIRLCKYFSNKGGKIRIYSHNLRLFHISFPPQKKSQTLRKPQKIATLRNDRMVFVSLKKTYTKFIINVANCVTIGLLFWKKTWHDGTKITQYKTVKPKLKTISYEKPSSNKDSHIGLFYEFNILNHCCLCNFVVVLVFYSLSNVNPLNEPICQRRPIFGCPVVFRH